MADIEHQITIKNNIVEVYKVATAFEDEGALQAWRSSIKSVGVTAGNPLRTGSMIAMKKNFITSEIFVNADVVDLQRNKRIEVKGIHGRFFYNREIEFTSSGRETLVNDRINIKTGFIYFWWRPILLNALKGQTAKEWQALKQLLED